MYIFKGKKLTKEQAEKIAAETDRDLTTFLNDNPEIEEDPDFGPQEESGKTSIIADQNAPAMIGSTALQLEDGSSGLTAYKDLTEEQKKQLNKQKKNKKTLKMGSSGSSGSSVDSNSVDSPKESRELIERWEIALSIVRT